MANENSANYIEILETVRKNFNSAHKGDKFISRAEIREIYLGFRDEIVNQLAQGNEVALPEFVKFELVHRDAHVARNPLNGEQVQVPAKTVVKVRNRKRLSEISK